MRKKKEAQKLRISHRAAVQRINRKLAKDHQFVRFNRRWQTPGPGGWDSMRYWVIDGSHGGSVDAFDDLEEYGRELDVIAEWETVEEADD